MTCHECGSTMRVSIVVVNVMWRRDPEGLLNSGLIELELCRSCRRYYWSLGMIPRRDRALSGRILRLQRLA